MLHLQNCKQCTSSCSNHPSWLSVQIGWEMVPNGIAGIATAIFLYLCRSGRPLGIFSCQLLAKMFVRWRSLTLFLPVFVGKNVCKIKIMVKQEVRTTLSFCIVQHCTVPCCNVLKLYYIQSWTRTNFWLRANAPLLKDLRATLRIFDPCSRR